MIKHNKNDIEGKKLCVKINFSYSALFKNVVDDINIEYIK